MKIFCQFMGVAMEHRTPKNTNRQMPQVSSRRAIDINGVSNRVNRRGWITWDGLNLVLGGTVNVERCWDRKDLETGWVECLRISVWKIFKKAWGCKALRQLAGANLAHDCDGQVIRWCCYRKSGASKVFVDWSEDQCDVWESQIPLAGYLLGSVRTVLKLCR